MKTILTFTLSLLASSLLAASSSAPSEKSSSAYELKPIDRHFGIHLRYDTGASANWAGYAAETNLATPALGAVTMVKGTWTVPQVTANGSTQPAYSAAWVGIDGYVDPSLTQELSGYSRAEQRVLLAMLQTVEQIGTGQDFTSSGPEYYAWVEFYPQGAFEIRGFPVKPGDQITASVVYLSRNIFQVNLSNDTQHKTFSASERFNADRYSAEWILEAPASSSGTVLPLADFGAVNFSNCSTTLLGATSPIGGSAIGAEALNMSASTGLKAITSSLDSTGSQFSVLWQSK